MKNKPIIGITMRLEVESNRFYLGRNYSEALQSCGAIPFHIGLIPNEDYLSKILNIVDGILLPGSDSDVDPIYYDEEPHPKLNKVVPEKDNTDLFVLKLAERLKLPILAICFGMQSLNVSRGGTLIQDIESSVENCIKHQQGVPLARNSHSIKVEKNSKLSALLNTTKARVNSHHHQAVKKVGRDLVATAWATDDVIECIEDTRNDRFVLGVQWHPELSWETDELSRNIFNEFVENCKKG